MGSSKNLDNWIELTAHVLSQPSTHDPMIEICAELARAYGSEGTGTIDFSTQRTRVELYRPTTADPARYAPIIADHPLVMHFLSTSDRHVRSLRDARRFHHIPRARAMIEDLREDGVVDVMLLPLHPVPGMEHRWLGMSAGMPFGPAARDEVDRISHLLWAIDAQSRVLSTSRTPSGSAELSARELAVLTLMARGLTAVAIGRSLGISPRTVTKHQEHIYRKLDVRDRLEAVLQAVSRGMLAAATSEECPIDIVDTAPLPTAVH